MPMRFVTCFWECQWRFMNKLIASMPAFFLAVLITSLILSGCLVRQDAARETAALRELQAIYGAEVMFHVTKNRYGALEELAKAKLIAEDVGRGMKSDYKFELELR